MKNTKHEEIFKRLQDENLQIDKNFKLKLKKDILSKRRKMANIKSKTFATKFKESFKNNRIAYSGGFATLIVLVVSIGAFAGTNIQRRNSLISSNTQLPSNLDGVKTIEEIKAIATADSQGKSISSVELENEEGTLVYKVKYSDGTYRLYNAKTGEAFVKIGEIEKDESVPSNFVAGVTIQQARDIAASKRPGKAISKIELETENGTVVYSIRFADGGKVYVNASNGSVLKIENPEIKRESNSGNSSSASDDRNDSQNESQDINDDNSNNSGSESDDSKKSEDSTEKSSGSPEQDD